MNQIDRPLPEWAVVTVWLGMVLAIILDVVVPLGGSGRLINLSAFDVVVPLCLILVWRVRPLRNPPYWLLAGLGVAAVLAVIHSAAIFSWSESIQLAGLARETAKLVAVCFLVAAALTLFRAPELRAPPIWIFPIAISVIAAEGLYHRYYEVMKTTPYLETLDANNIVGVAVLWLALLVGPGRSHAGGAGIAVVAAAAILVILLGSKTYVLVTVSVLVVLAMTWVAGPHPGKGLPRLLILGGGLAFGGVIAYALSELTLLGSIFFEQSFRSVGDSLSIRLVLWDYAVELAKASFPWGVGLGQFGALVDQSPALAGAGMRYVHNTPLALVTELGALGLAGVAGLVYLVYLACRGWSVSVMAAFLLYLAIPMLLHSALGMRMTLLVIAFGIVRGLDPRPLSG